MQTNSVNSNIQNENRLTVASGALVGGVSAKCITNGRINHLAKNTLKAMYQDTASCDTFVKKHEDLLLKTSLSKKGFFGKVNKLVRKTNGTAQDIANSTEDVFRSYGVKAAKKSVKHSGLTEDIVKRTEVIQDNLIKKDIGKSIKDATKHKNALIALGAAALGAFAFSIGKELLLQYETKKVIKEAAQETKDIKKIPAKNEQSEQKALPDKIDGEVQSYIDEANDYKNLEKAASKKEDGEKIQSYIDEANNFENLDKKENE